MFCFESLELLYWDYWERVKIPLDEDIIIIVGPNGSGKTTLLDAIRTLLGTKTSEKRDYKRYARKSNKPYSWIVATVRNQRDKSNRQCFYPIVDERVTIACKIEKKGGEWQRGYFIMPGVVPIEQMTSLPFSNMLGLKEYQSILQKAGLSPAMLRVLALEQGATDRLCEYSPREMLSLVYDAFGDKPTLENYEKARQDQKEAERELVDARIRVERLENQLSTVTNRVNNYLEYASLIKKKSYLETEVKSQAQYVDMADAIEGIRRNVTGLKREVESMRASIADIENELKGLKDIENALKKDRDSVSSYIQEHQQRLIEDNRKRASIEASISEIERLSEDVKGIELQEIDALRQEHEIAVKKAGLLEQEIENTDKNIGEIKARISALNAGIIRPDSPIEEFSLLLKSEGIQHSFLYEGVEVINEKWSLAIESILRGYRYIIILKNPAQKWKAWELGEKSGYRHFIVADIGNRDIQTPEGSALSAVRLKDFVPEWIKRQLADIYLVDTVKNGQSLPEGSAFVTAKGYMKERRGGRSIAVAEGDFIFGTSGKKRQLEFLLSQRDELTKQKEVYNAQLRTLSEHISTLAETIRLQEALRRYLARKDEEDNFKKELQTVNSTIDSTEKELKSLSEKSKALDSQYEDNHDKLIKLQRDTESQKDAFKKKIEDCRIQRKDLLDKIQEFRRHRVKMPPEWRTAEKIAFYKETFGDIKIVNKHYEDVTRKLNEGQWEKDPKVIELKAKIEQDYNGELTNLKKKEYELEETKKVTNDARDAYINVLRGSIRFYERNLKKLGQLAGVGIEVIKPQLSNDDSVLKEAGLEIRWNFDEKGFTSADSGDPSGGQQVITSLILLISLMMDERAGGGFVFIDEPFAHLDVFNIDKVAEFLLATETQFIITSPNTHNINVYRPAMLTIVTKKKRPGEEFAQPPGHIRRLNARA